jgi:leader peptidase (prepilin peptidase)/N-methyltransferase
MLSILAFIYGASIGSFVQVIASRFRVAPIMKGRSKCLSCGEALRPSDLVPVLSYFLLRGRCRYCRTTYGISALVIEIVFGLCFVFLYLFILAPEVSLLNSFLLLLYYTVLFGVMGVMALYDRAHSYIPSPFLLAFLVLSSLMFGIRVFGDISLINLLSPFFVALPFFLLWLITKGKGLGFGDVILFFGVGEFFGTSRGLAVLVISVWVGALFGLYVKYLMPSHTTNKIHAIPFVPFIVIAFLFVLFTHIDVLSIAMFFS